MMFLPIQFRQKLKKDEINDLSSTEILTIVRNWLVEQGFNHVIMKKDKIVFHKADMWTSFNVRSYLVSGVVKVENRDDGLVIVNGNWMVFLVSIPFLIVILLIKSKYSTIDVSDNNLIVIISIILFGANLIIRIVAHWWFKSIIKMLIQNRLKSNNDHLLV